MGTCAVCGGRVGFMKGRLTKHASDLAVGARFVLDNAETIAEAIGRDQATVEHHARSGEVMADGMHDYAHGARGDGSILGGPILPSQTEMFTWQKQTNGLTQALIRHDEQTFRTYLGGLSGHAARLVRSMGTEPAQGLH